MATISRMSKSELHELAAEHGYATPEDETDRESLIYWLRENTDVVSQSRRKTGPKRQEDRPSISNDGEKIKLPEESVIDLAECPALSELVDEVMRRTGELYRGDTDDHATFNEFWQVAELVIAACDSPNRICFDAVAKYRTAGLRQKFFVITHRAVLAVMRNRPRQYGSAVQVAIVDAVCGMAGNEHAERRGAIVDEARRLKGMEVESGKGQSAGSEPTPTEETTEGERGFGGLNDRPR